MKNSRRAIVVGAVLVCGALGGVGVAYASDDSDSTYGDTRDHCLENNHSGTDSAINRECDGYRDIRDDDPEGQRAKGLFEDGLLPHGERH